MKPNTILLSAVSGVCLLAAALTGADRQEPAPANALVLNGEGPATAYHAAVIHTAGSAGAIKDGYLVVQDGKVVGVVASASDLPPMLNTVELGSAEIIPGLVAADTTVTGADGQGDRSMAAHNLASDSFDPYMDTTKVLERGITTYYLSPDRSRLIGGRGAVVKSAGQNSMLEARGDLRVNLTTTAWNPPDYFRPPIPPTAENPILPAKAQAPNSRPGAMLALRQAFAATSAGGDLDPNMAGLQDFLASDAALRLIVDTADEAQAGVDLAKEWGRHPVLAGLSQANAAQLVSVLESHNATLLFEVPLFISMPDLDATWQFPDANLLGDISASTPVALHSGRYGRWTWLLEAAAASTGYGLSEANALRGITTVPADILGVGQRVGRLEKGFDADFVILDGGPLDAAASVQKVYIDGKKVWSRSGIQALKSDAVVVRAGTLWTGDGAPMEGGVEVLLEEGRIVAAGRTVPHPAGARIVDAGADAHITPGFIDARGYVGTGGAQSMDARVDLGRLADGSYFSDLWRPVAQSGITSMVMGPRNLSAKGTRASVVKTAAGVESGSLEDRFVVFFDVRSSDHAASRKEMAGQLKKGKDYFDKWQEFRSERAAWELENTEKVATERADKEKALRIRLAQGSAPKVEEVVVEEIEEVVVEEKEAKPVDPINGLWAGILEHEMLGDQTIEMNARLHHEGKQLTGIFSTPEAPGEDFEIEGTFENNMVHFEIPTEVGNVMIDGIIDAPDSMSVKIELAGFGSADLVMTRTEIEEDGAAPIAKKKIKQDDGPQAPSKDWDLEGHRAMFEGRGRAVVAASRRDEIESVLALFAEYELPVQLMYADDALDMVEQLRAGKVGIVVSPAVTARRENVDYVPAAELHAAGIPIAFQSDRTQGARFLPQLLTMATRYGLGAEQALAGLTSSTADMLGIADRVGRVKQGLDGDIVIFQGHPFDLRSRVTHVFVNGREVPQQ
ncbi:MAG: amidohydrolase family protein [Planctomycetota bacterium]|nr:amidohydrolase family protein [Planctomycetota bacterium]MDA1114570.1 amidohydrolase family protein [Planctomycetota bacterium]